MAWGNFVLDKGMNASAAITKYRFVKGTASTPEAVTPVTAVGDDVLGVAQFGVSAAEIARGKGASVRVIGVSEVETGGAVTIWSRVQLTNDGRVVNLVGASAARSVGICVGHPATGSGERATILLTPGGPLA